MKKKLLIIVVFACLLGSIFSIISTSQYFRIQKTGLEEKSICAISDLVNCDVATASSYATFAKIPISWIGFLAYLVIGGMSLISLLSTKDRKDTVAVSWFLSLFTILYSIRMAYVLFAILKVICLYCLSLYIINIIIFITLWIVLGVPVKKIMIFIKNYILAILNKKSKLDFKPQFFIHVIIIGVIFFVGWAGMYSKVVSGQGRMNKIPLDDKVKAHYVQSLYDINVDSSWPVWGNPEAKVTIIEFSEFQCPFCKRAAFNFKPILYEFKDHIRFYYVNYPLDNTCNKYLNYPMHPKACLAAYAGYCSNLEGGFWNYHDDLFRIGKDLNKESILKLAKDKDYDMEKFSACIDSDLAKQKILDDIEIGKHIHVEGVPTIIINGRKLKYWSDKDFVRAIVKEEIKIAK